MKLKEFVDFKTRCLIKLTAEDDCYRISLYRDAERIQTIEFERLNDAHEYLFNIYQRSVL
jgi:hypothetical protein